MPIRIENVLYICDENSIIELSGNGNTIKNVKFYTYDEGEWDVNKNPFRRIFLYLGHIFRRLSDLCYGIDSGFKICCIGAYILSRTLTIPEIKHGLCHKCYKRMLGLKDNG